VINFIVLIWIVASAYAVISVIRPLRPFRARWQAALALVGVQIVCIAAAIPFTPSNDQPPPPPVATAVAPKEKSPDVALVMIDPNAPKKPISEAAKRDANQARLEMKDDLRLIEAGEALLGSALSAGNRDAVQLVRRDMQQLDIKLTKRRPPLGGDPWPPRAEEAHLACGQAANRLSMIAASALDATTLEGVAFRNKSSEQYLEYHEQCAAWVGKG